MQCHDGYELDGMRCEVSFLGVFCLFFFGNEAILFGGEYGDIVMTLLSLRHLLIIIIIIIIIIISSS